MWRDGPQRRGLRSGAGRRRTWHSTAATTEQLPAGRATTGPGIVGGGRSLESRSVAPTPERQEGEGCSGPLDDEKPISLRRRVAPSRSGEGLGWGREGLFLGRAMKALVEQQQADTMPLGREEAVGMGHSLGQAVSPGYVRSEASWCERLAVTSVGEADS